jgi:hypothetical protein
LSNTGGRPWLACAGTIGWELVEVLEATGVFAVAAVLVEAMGTLAAVFVLAVVVVVVAVVVVLAVVAELEPVILASGLSAQHTPVRKSKAKINKNKVLFLSIFVPLHINNGFLKDF